MKLVSGCFAFMLLLATQQAAHALMFNFAYTGDGISAAGVLTTNDAANLDGSYTIIDITGSRNEVGVQSLIQPGGLGNNDNKLILDGPYLNINGFSFTTSDGASFNVYYTAPESGCDGDCSTHIGPGHMTPTHVNNDTCLDCPPSGYFELSNGEEGIPVNFDITAAITAVPEPASLTLLGLALGGLGAIRRRKAGIDPRSPAQPGA